MQWISLGEISLVGTLLIIMVLIIRSLNKQKLSHGAILLLWQIVLIRLLLPVSIPTSISPLNNVGAIKDLFYLNTSQEMTYPTSLDATEMLSEDLSSPPPSPSQTQLLTLSQLLTLIWLFGMLGLMGYFTVLAYCSHRVLKEALPIKSFTLPICYLQTAKRPITLLESDRLSTPITYGILKPKIIFPKAMSHLPKDLNYVLTHEMIHIQSYHVLWKKAALLLVCIYWFNPLVWVMYHFINKDIELACDEKVLQQMGQEEKEGYALSLLHLAAEQKSFWTLSSAFGKNAIEERIMSIMKKRNTSLLVTLGIITLSVTATCLSATTSIPIRNQATHQISSMTNPSLPNYETYNLQSEFKDYEKYGLIYNVDEDTFYYNNLKVKFFVDKLFPDKDTVRMFTRPDGTIFVKALRGKYNQLTGLKQTTLEELDSFFTDASPSESMDYQGSGLMYKLEEPDSFSTHVSPSESMDYQSSGLMYKAEEPGSFFTDPQSSEFMEQESSSLIYKPKNSDSFFTDPLLPRFIDSEKSGLIYKVDELDSSSTNSQKEPNEIPAQNESVAISSTSEENTLTLLETPNAKEAYHAFGVTYNESNDTWEMNGQLISLLYDEGYHTYVNNSKEALKKGVKLQVLRNQDHTIRSINSLTEKELTQLRKKVPFLNKAL